MFRFLMTAFLALVNVACSLCHNDFVGGNSHGYSSINFDGLKGIKEKYKTDDSISDDLIINPCSNEPRCGAHYCDTKDIAYYPSTSFNMRSFFENAYEYIPLNNAGSCGYISLIEVMSFYDTFYNDNVIPEKYDCHFENAVNINEAIADSPGVLRENYDSNMYPTYYDFCCATENYNLQSKLLLINNSIRHATGPFVVPMGGGEYQDLLNNFYSDGSFATVHEYYFNSLDEYIELTKEIIDTGNPVILQVCNVNSNGEETGHHSIVAYDYDSNGIYMNNGLERQYAHSLILDHYNCIYAAYVIDYSSIGHSHSNNYIINGESFCGCNTETSGLCFEHMPQWTNVPPTIKWMRNPHDKTETYTIGFRGSQYSSDVLTINTGKNRLTLSYNQWKIVMDNLDGWIYVSLTRHSSVFQDIGDSFIAFFKPVYHLNSFFIAPSQYGFADAYPVDSMTSNEYKEVYVPDAELSFRTRRYRTGYIHNEYIVMSCIRDNISEAYIEYAFNTPVQSIQVDLSHWRSPASEWLTSANGFAELQCWFDFDLPPIPFFTIGTWMKVFDLLSNETNLTSDRTNPTNYEIIFPLPIYSFRFYSKVNTEYHINSNKGRICIGDMTIRFAN